jgi:hypothetical protein
MGGNPAFSHLDLTVSGMTLSNMNALTTLGLNVSAVRKNTVTVEAGDVPTGLATVFQGQIREAWADFSGMPNVVFRVQADGAGLETVKPIPPTTFNGLTDVVTILRGLATQAKWGFQNDGVTAHLIDPYLPGTIYDQMRTVVEHTGINMLPGPPTMVIWPKGGARGGSVPIVSPDTGLIGYPTFTQSAIQLTTLFNPGIGFGQKIQVKSSVKIPNQFLRPSGSGLSAQANPELNTPSAATVAGRPMASDGMWQVISLSHTLESETPSGQWHSRILASVFNGPTVIATK